MKEETIRIEDILDGVKKRWQLIVSITLAVTIIATVANFFLIKPKYQATTDIFIGKNVRIINIIPIKQIIKNDILLLIKGF